MSDNAISQMQMRYVPEEDRVLFRVNSTDGKQFGLWLTRRFILLLLNMLKKHTDSDPDVSIQATPEAKEAIQSYKRDKAMEGANFKDEFKEDLEEAPLGDAVPLAYRLNYRLEGDILHLGIEPKSGKGINLTMNRDINASLTQLISAAAQKANWQLAVSAEMPANTPIVVN